MERAHAGRRVDHDVVQAMVVDACFEGALEHIYLTGVFQNEQCLGHAGTFIAGQQQQVLPPGGLYDVLQGIGTGEQVEDARLLGYSQHSSTLSLWVYVYQQDRISLERQPVGQCDGSGGFCYTTLLVSHCYDSHVSLHCNSSFAFSRKAFKKAA